MLRKPLTTKEEIFGKVTEVKVSRGFSISSKNLNEPFSDNDSVVRSFCIGCGYHLELSNEKAINFAEKANIKAPQNWEEYYFVTNKCVLCDQGFGGISLKEK